MTYILSKEISNWLERDDEALPEVSNEKPKLKEGAPEHVKREFDRWIKKIEEYDENWKKQGHDP